MRSGSRKPALSKLVLTLLASVLTLTVSAASDALAQGVWLTTGSMSVPREGHTATLLTDGRVLVAGGDSSETSAEIYLPPANGYDGDGKADIAVYRRSTGEWFIQRSSDGGLSHVGWGWPGGGDIAVPADYDGDGKADIAVYRSSTGEWFIQRSSDGGLTHLTWGCPS